MPEATTLSRGADAAPPAAAMLEAGQAARRAGDHGAALAHFERAVLADPKNRKARLEAAAELRDLGRLDEAEAALRGLLAENARDNWALFGLGLVARRRGDRAAALARFEEAVAAAPADGIWARLECAAELRDAGRLDEAEAALRAVPAGAPGRFQALAGLGLVARRRGDRAAALARFEEAVAAAPAGEPSARLEAAAELRDAGRLDEAEAHYRAVLDVHPRNYWAAFGLGFVARARGDRGAALARFQRAAELETARAPAWLEIAAELRERGEFARARAAAETLVGRGSDRFHGWMSVGQTERRAGDRRAALEAFRRASEADPGNPLALVEMAADERALGRPEASEQLLERALGIDGRCFHALLQLGELARMAQDFGRALALFRDAAAAQPSNMWGHLATAQALADLGELDAALAALDGAEGRLGPLPDFGVKRAELLRRAGDWARALGIARETAGAAPRHFGAWVARAQLESLVGGDDALAACLREPPAATAQEAARVHHLRGLAAEADWRVDEAIGCYGRALALHPADRWARGDSARARLLAVDVEGARADLRALVALDDSAAVQGRSRNASQTHLGQILDEFLLDPEALAELAALRGLEPERRLPPMLALARRAPDHTPAALCALVAMRQAGAFARGRAAGAGRGRGRSPIPRRIAQYWDQADPGPDLTALVRTWRDAHPDHAHTLFDDAAARAFLRAKYAADVSLAYARAPEPAQKADLFRLAWLFAEGGYYADADDRCLAPLGAAVPGHAALAVYLEEYGTLGNNFIGAAPRHPVVGLALDLAVEAVNRGDRDIIWLSTGPGLLTRAFVQTVAGSRLSWRAWLEDVAVLDRRELHRAVATHCFVPYKTTDRHWLSTAFGARNARPRGMAAESAGARQH